jgi:hypothetical protein
LTARQSRAEPTPDLKAEENPALQSGSQGVALEAALTVQPMRTSSSLPMFRPIRSER